MLVSRTDGASTVPDYFSTQGNIDNATLTQAIEGTENANTYMTPYTNVERILLTDAPSIALITNDLHRTGDLYT